jgi:hypothetical protein
MRRTTKPVLQLLPCLAAPLGESGDGPLDGALGRSGGTDLHGGRDWGGLLCLCGVFFNSDFVPLPGASQADSPLNATFAIENRM